MWAEKPICRLEQLARGGRQNPGSAAGVEGTVRREHVNVGVEVDQVAEGLDEQDEARSRAGLRACIEASEQALDNDAQFSKQRPSAGE